MIKKEQTLLGFDFGTKRIGVAVGQTVTQRARALTILEAREGVPSWDAIQKLIKNWQPDALIVGVPLNMDGTPQPMTEAAKVFSEELKKRFHLPLYEMDERLSTKAAREHIFNEGGYKALQDGQIDSVAAQFILQNWLDEYSKQE